MPPMQSLRGILNFVRVAELGSFAAAARELGISAVAVSQNISRLEAALNVRLLARSTRALSLTPEGQAFLAQCRAPLAALDAACSDARSGAHHASGLVRASLVSPVAYLYVVPLLGRFFERHPQVRLALELSEDTAPLVGKRFDVGIRVAPMADAAFVARPLGALQLPLCAAPSHLQLHGTPRNEEALVSGRHALLCLQPAGQESPLPFFLQSPGSGGGVRTLPTRDSFRLACSDYRSLLLACIDGVGIAQLPLPLALPALRSGALRCVLPESAPQGWKLFIHYPSRKQLPARVRAFVDFCIEHLADHDDLKVELSTLAV
jgi:DNA-binding transcriptional LysR family regulator